MFLQHFSHEEHLHPLVPLKSGLRFILGSCVYYGLLYLRHGLGKQVEAPFRSSRRLGWSVPMNWKYGEVMVMEMNPWVMWPSIFTSKATRFPIPKMVANISMGYTLDENPNGIANKNAYRFWASYWLCCHITFHRINQKPQNSIFFLILFHSIDPNIKAFKCFYFTYLWILC